MNPAMAKQPLCAALFALTLCFSATAPAQPGPAAEDEKQETEKNPTNLFLQNLRRGTAQTYLGSRYAGVGRCQKGGRRSGGVRRRLSGVH